MSTTTDVTPAACRQLARLFRARQLQSEEIARQAAQALAGIDARTDRALAPWGRDLLTAAFEALRDAEQERVRRIQDGLDALDAYSDEEPDDAA